ncbi:MAG: hypothetical protein SPH91_00210 [Lachnospiraceae bacterium]|jgi:uncharacterized membrane protein|nr:hypothetical protein [Lachnospiraceae bacterium]MCI6331442.1 hypothetical protein [Lachnospiraceae bacterium]MCI6409841.1 hypothetical protein [Lachnospiraceae bacterium]MCI6665604.1 hypothetical protein [Lachnospiraceae bacterium]MDD6580490.1 hypothetical protein [Lachnospiraceae bacterium]
MYNYEVWQWVLYFFIYCFIGWIWETAYVSLKSGHFENRGFMNGPFLPIYGSGAIIMLFVSLPVKNSVILVFIFGSIAATLLELFTGMAMESLFHVRYWDYSYRKIQYKGHICLVSSIAWGFFSCLLVYFIHKPIEGLVLSIDEGIGQLIAIIVTICATADFATSFKTALELKNMLITAEDIKKQIEKLERRAEIVEVFIADSAEKASEDLREHISDIIEKISGSKEEAKAELNRILAERNEKVSAFKLRISENKSVSALLKRNPDAVSVKHFDTFSTYKKNIIDSVKEKLNR